MAATLGAQPRQQRTWLRAPKFLLAIPSFVWYVFLFVVPVCLVIVNSFGRKVTGSPGKVDLSSPSLDR